MTAQIVTSVTGPHVPGDRTACVIDFTGSTSYTTGGYALANTDFGLPTTLTKVVVHGQQGVSDIGVWNPVTKKLLFCRVGGANAAIIETPSTTDVSGVVVRLEGSGF